MTFPVLLSAFAWIPAMTFLALLIHHGYQASKKEQRLKEEVRQLEVVNETFSTGDYAFRQSVKAAVNSGLPIREALIKQLKKDSAGTSYRKKLADEALTAFDYVYNQCIADAGGSNPQDEDSDELLPAITELSPGVYRLEGIDPDKLKAAIAKENA